MIRISRFGWFTLLAILILAPSPSASGQEDPLRVGFGFDAVLQPEEGLGLGIRSRLSKPLTWDISAALDIGITSFLLQGRDDASFAFEPQLSIIVTFPDRDRATYLLGGFGAYAPFGVGHHAQGGPTIHAGVGRAVTLRESTLYYEIDPAMIIQESTIVATLPFRIGIIL